MTLFVDDPDFTLHVGDALETLQAMPDESVHCCVTSPPYWGLRDYGTGEWEGGDAEHTHDTVGARGGRGGSGTLDKRNADAMPDTFAADVCSCGATRVDQQLGLEPTPGEYVANMVNVFREIRRVLRKDGTLWLNMGSSYFGGESYPIREIDAAWLAAVIDGEGCIQIHQQRRPPETNCVDSFQVDLSVGMMTPEVVQRCYAITGLGSCKQQNRGVWDWSVRGQQAAQLLRAIYPYLLGKRKQAALAIMLADDLAGRKYGRGNPADPEVMAWRGEIRTAVSDCNQRRGTDFPIVEPKPIALNLKAKDDVGIPHKLYFALRDDGWYARMDIIWAKPNPMPESVTDRPTKSHEYVFLLTKNPRYYFDQDAIRETATWDRWGDQTNGKYVDQDGMHAARMKPKTRAELQARAAVGRNKRSVWEIATEAYPDAHFATFPQALVEPCVKAGCPEWVCGTCGKARERIVEKTAVPHPNGGHQGRHAKGDARGMTDMSDNPRFNWKVETLGWSDCGHNNYQPGVVLDPFLGSGTTAQVARRLGRKCVGIELNPEYAQLAARRLQQLSLFAVEPAEA